MLAEYWEEDGGRMYVEVPLVLASGNFGLGARPRRVDAVILPGYRDRQVASGKRAYTRLIDEVKGRRVILVEAKRALNRPAVGQLVVGKALFERQYPGHRNIRLVAS